MARDGWADLVPVVERVLAAALGGSVRVGSVEPLTEPSRRNEVLRCALERAPDAAPTSLVVKRRRARHDEEATSGGFDRDWAGLEFLTQVGPELVASPRFYGGDAAAGFVVMEDLGTPTSLADLLLEGQADEAERGLVMLARTIGRMHAATIGREPEYERIRAALGPTVGRRERAEQADELRGYAGHVLNVASELGASVPAGVDADIASVAAALADPGAFLSFTHGDPCPDNNAIVGERFRLIDFELGGYRHALLDGVYGRMRFPTCWCVGELPRVVLERMESAYREELLAGCPDASDDATYMRAVTEACAAWLLTTIRWSLFHGMLEDDPVWGLATHRQRAIARLATFAELAGRTGYLQALAETAEELHGRLRSRWQSLAPVAVYPAFAA